jgi:nitrate reductase molybdenum cofactor assembly chaperone NarJ/NarW
MTRRTRRGGGESASGPLLPAIASILLRYPDHQVLGRLDDIAAARPALPTRSDRARVTEVVDWLRGTSPTEAAQHYVTTFDHTRHRSLHLTYYRHGDTRQRGMALLALKHTYRQAGYPPPEDELPDFLPLMLEFAAAAPDAGQRVLQQCQAGLELLRRGLSDAGSHYLPVVAAVCAGLPDLSPRQRTELDQLTAAGPPVEQVGLEPFAPPGYLTGGRR